MNIVDLSKVRMDLKWIPQSVQRSLARWIRTVELFGLREMRQIKGYHDEPLSGKRLGQRSARLSLKWRVIYRETETQVIIVEEVTPHDYRTR